MIAPWPAIFLALGLFAAVLAIWLFARLGETLRPEHQRSIEPREIMAAAKIVLTDRCSIGYTLGQTMSFGAMIGFVTSAQQLFTDAFDAGDSFPVYFALIAIAMAVAAFVNSRLVLRFGSRRLSHTALIGYIITSGMHLLSINLVGDSLLSFTLFQFTIMFFSGLMGSNFSAMAMEQMGTIAGTASSVQGTITTLGATAIGIVVGQSFDGSPVPVVTGFFLAGIFALAAALFAERGKLFRPQHAQPEPAQ